MLSGYTYAEPLLFPPPPRPPADLAWEGQVVWEGPWEAAERLRGAPLWLDMNDPGLTFEYSRKQGTVPLVEQAAAQILPHVVRVSGRWGCLARWLVLLAFAAAAGHCWD